MKGGGGRGGSNHQQCFSWIYCIIKGLPPHIVTKLAAIPLSPPHDFMISLCMSAVGCVCVFMCIFVCVCVCV